MSTTTTKLIKPILPATPDTIARDAIQTLLDGGSPNYSLKGLGQWGESYMALCNASERGGTRAVKRAFGALIVNNPQLSALIASNPPRTLPNLINGTDLLKQQFPPIKWAVPNLIAEGVSILAGAPKMGKSWLMLDFCIALACGGKVLGQLQVQQGSVLYLALEDNPRRLQQRVCKLIPSPSTDLGSLNFMVQCSRLNEGGLDEITQWLDKHSDARLVVIDTLARVKPPSRGRNAYEEDYEAVIGLKQLADRYSVPIVVVHHLRKERATDPMERISGSTGLTGAVDGWLLLDRERGKHDAVLYVTGRDIEEDQELALQWNQATAIWSLLGDAKEFRTTEIRALIRDVFRASDEVILTPQAVCKALQSAGNQVNYEQVKQRMYQMEHAGELVVSGRGQYRLPPGHQL